MQQIKNQGMDIHFMGHTWCMTPELETHMEDLGCSAYYEKPLKIKALVDNAMEDLFSGPKGIIDGISISSFLQMIEMEEKTFGMVIRNEEKDNTYFVLTRPYVDGWSWDFDHEDTIEVEITI